MELDARIAASELDTAILAACGRIAEAVASTLAAAGVGADRVDTLIVTGGSTRVPGVSRLLDALFPAAKRVATDAFGSVGLGLAIDAGRRFGAAGAA